MRNVEVKPCRDKNWPTDATNSGSGFEAISNVRFCGQLCSLIVLDCQTTCSSRIVRRSNDEAVYFAWFESGIKLLLTLTILSSCELNEPSLCWQCSECSTFFLRDVDPTLFSTTLRLQR